MAERPYTRVIALLQQAGLRPTRQRLALARLLFDEGNRHVTAEDLHREARKAGVSVSLATIYNTLNQFTISGLLREVVVEPGRAYFDTNTSGHHHFFFEKTGEICDIPEDEVAIARLPQLPDGATLSRVDVVVRIRESTSRD
ncbi:MAG: transcriptional repressor [Rhodospirillaceae bacterium]|jgi:Fur family iron response transcriptional regulator|nr:transcriptional repressor [Rhodospirillaceae bacterium]MBT5048156.1 transcriptional repressor [Rhodospirillaceae bacterium]MBT5458356.1 transcriptional repressor [Rhodospirillaceae bacterium]